MKWTRFLAAAWLVSAAFAAPPFTLEQILSAPFPSALTAAPAGGGVAWVLNDRGVRNIWIAATPAYVGKPITSYTADDGQEISELAFTPDGATLLYVRGGAANLAGDAPNPTSDPGGAEQAVWAVSAEGGSPRRIAEGNAPLALSDDAVLFVRKGAIRRAALSGDAQPAPLFKMRGSAASLRLSPNRKKLAFVSRRGDHSFVGVYDFQSETVRWLDPGIDRDGYPVWAPDSKRIAFIRLPSNPALARFGPHRAGPPWSVRAADASTGKGREVWRADSGPGSIFFPVEGPRQLWWSSGNRLVFPWERDGRLHLWSVGSKGGVETLLTPGRFDVEHVTLTADRSALYYSSNQDDIDRRHIWQVAIRGDGVAPARLTAGDGIEWSPAPVGDSGRVAFLRSDARLPARAAILNAAPPGDAGKARDLAPGMLPRNFPADRLVEPRPVTFPAADGLEIRGQLFLPPDARADHSHPAVLFFHGGSRRQMLLGWHSRGYYHNAYALNQFLASKGYVVLSVNYRSGTGYGMEFREALDYGAAGGSEYNDVLGAGLYVRSLPEVDPKKIGLWGGSYGGYLTALGLARASDLFAAGVDFHGVHDWSTELEPHRIAREQDPDRDERFRVAFESSPQASVDTWRSPVLLIHGDDDHSVRFTQTSELLYALREREVETELLVFPDEAHGFLTHSRWLEAYRATVDFFDRKLRGPAR